MTTGMLARPTARTKPSRLVVWSQWPAVDHGLDGLGADFEEAHVVHEPAGADAGVGEHAVLAALLGEGDERRESVLAPQLLDHLASFESGRACSRHMLGGKRKPPRRALVRHEGIG
jgi:hypothetical protein